MYRLQPEVVKSTGAFSRFRLSVSLAANQMQSIQCVTQALAAGRALREKEPGSLNNGVELSFPHSVSHPNSSEKGFLLFVTEFVRCLLPPLSYSKNMGNWKSQLGILIFIGGEAFL